MANLGEFKQRVTEYRKQAKPYDDNRKPSQRELALAINMNDGDFSRSMSGERQFSQDEVRRIIRGLAEWEVITTRQQAQELLALMDCPDFTPAQWGAEPLDRLVDRPQQQTVVEDAKIKMKPAMPTPPEPSDSYSQVRKQLDILIAKLLACPSMRSASSQEIIVRQLPDDIQFAIDHAQLSNLKERLTLIVETCMQAEGGLEILIQRLHAFDKGTIRFNELMAFLASNNISVQFDT